MPVRIKKTISRSDKNNVENCSSKNIVDFVCTRCNKLRVCIYYTNIDRLSITHTWIVCCLSTTPTWIVCLPHQQGSYVYHINMNRLSTTSTWIVCPPHQHGSSVHHTNMDRLSTTSTWTVCPPHQHGSSVYHTNAKLDTLSF